MTSSATPDVPSVPGELSSPFYESILTPFSETSAQRALEEGRDFVPVLQGQLRVNNNLTLPLPPSPIPQVASADTKLAGDGNGGSGTPAGDNPTALSTAPIVVAEATAPPAAPPPLDVARVEEPSVTKGLPRIDMAELATITGTDRAEAPAATGSIGAQTQAAQQILNQQPTRSRTLSTQAVPPASASADSAVMAPSRHRSLAMIGPEPVVPPTPQQIGRDRFDEVVVNPVTLTREQPVSTFSIDVDTASYSFIRGQLSRGVLPQPDAVRIEEMVNYFDYVYPVPEDIATPFEPTVAVYPAPWNQNSHIMHVGIKGYDLPAGDRPRANLTFLVDTSGSMTSGDKLPLLQQSLRMLLDEMADDDTIAIVTYAGGAGVVLEPTPAAERRTILNAINNMTAGGSTAGGAGIRLAYDLAAENFDEQAVNRVILGTDGDFNVGITSTQELQGFIERQRDQGIFLSVLGFGQGNYNDSLMQALAQNGNGTAAYIDTVQEARKVLVEEASSTLFPIAKDVKIQVEFNPAQITEYRLIGYESRLLAREDFNNDRVDAGDIGAGHTVTALYEVVLTDNVAGRRIDPLRYATTAEEQPADPAAATAVTPQSQQLIIQKIIFDRSIGRNTLECVQGCILVS
ncbi:MAG: VWA domain-containing protein [Pseudomonadota bacterium]